MEASRLDPAKGKFRLDIGGRARQRIAARRAELELDMRSTAKPDWRHQATLRLPDEWLNIEADDKVASRLYVEMDPELLNGLKGSWLVVAGRVKLYLNEQGDRLATDEPLVVTPEAMEIR
jgi:hypothetical protein